MENERRKVTRWYTCPVCGHEWKSTGYQKRVFCPKCYENRTGKKLGGSPEHMAAMRGKLEEKRAAASRSEPSTSSTDLMPQYIQNHEPDSVVRESVFDRIFNKKIL